MTAITFPLKKFPGQVRHEDIGFTGRVSSLPILTVFALLFHLSLSLMYNADLFALGLSFLPLLYVFVVFSVYVSRTQRRGADYFGLSFDMLVDAFDADRRYFLRMFRAGFFVLALLWLIGMRFYSVPLLFRLVVNSFVLSTFISRVSVEGVYSQRKLFSMLSLMLLVEVFYWSLSARYAFVDFGVAPIILVLFYLTTRKVESYQPIQLLQNIIS